ncbi:hypothetical protein Acr_00g0021850 [Actinidia rufa]|uniref:WRC domain-containing protein n=1 Tax=Actinidia rufa TaxID=165716 RepID=A0A7J0DE69_9ERIC|nr:hypothetical protein Acr_00g0021850 [Actinidia rufa]
MRIRKYANQAGLKLANTLSSTYLSNPHTFIQPHICQLNQSPWDVISFPPDSASSPYQVGEDDCFIGISNFGDSHGLVKSVVSKERSINRGKKNAKNEVPKEVSCDIDATENVEKRAGVVERKDQLGANNEPFTFCCRNDGKGWRCKKRARDGHCLCKHHLDQLKMYKKIGSFY